MDETSFHDRARADSFGSVAQSYDAYRPRYPQQAIDDVMAMGVHTLLDVGAGTGIASQQFASAGADVIAVEPDSRMAALAQAKGIATEVAKFEDWLPVGRTFDAVTFAQSFHWVNPAVALPKVRSLLQPHGHLVLLWNRFRVIAPTEGDLAKDYVALGIPVPPPQRYDHDTTPEEVSAYGFRPTTQTYPANFRYTADDWLNMHFTFSRQVTLPPKKSAALRARFLDRIGADGVTIAGDTLVITCAPVD